MGTIAAFDGTHESVQAAINSAADGDIVTVPADNKIWDTPVSSSGKGLTLIGAGVDVTTIIDGTDSSNIPLNIDMNAGQTFKMSGFTFDGTNSSTWGIVNFSGGIAANFRVHHNKFANLATRGVVVGESTYGLIDHNAFLAPFNLSAQAISVFGDGVDAWNRALSLGSGNAVYVEDNTFTYAHPNDGAMDAYNGARYVFRHNAVSGTTIGHHGFDTGGYQSTFSFEIYENTWVVVNKIWWGNFRGGTGVIFNNTFTNFYGTTMEIANYRSCRTYDDWGRCDGLNPLDGNEDATGYPCRQQIGRTTGQALSPFYQWGNLSDGVSMMVSVNQLEGCTNPSPNDHLKENRDFYNNIVKPGYSAYTYPHPLQGIEEVQNILMNKSMRMRF